MTAYSGDLRDESLDGQRVVVGGIVTGVRTVITKAKATMAIVSLEDLQGGIEVVVFPRMFEESRPTWTEGRILLVAGRIDHKGEDVSLLADLAVDWDEAVGRGPEAFARDVAAGDRSRGRGGRPNGNGNGASVGGRPSGGQRQAGGYGPGAGERAPVAVGPGPGAPPPVVVGVSPLRPGATAAIGSPGSTVPTSGDAGSEREPVPPQVPATADLPRIVPAEPLGTYPESSGSGGTDLEDDEPPLPDEARARVAGAARAPTLPLEARPDQVLHVRFAASAGTERAMEAFRQVLRSHPGATRVVLHVPAGRSDAELPMELRSGVAYDAELVAEVGRRLGDGSVELRLA